jgi:hypothetical protein
MSIKYSSQESLLAGATPISDVPDTPTIGVATDAGTGSSVSVSYTAASTGGTATTFTAISTPGNITATGSSPITISGLSTGTSYTFKVKASNSTGESQYSSLSNSVTPVASAVSVDYLILAGGGGVAARHAGAYYTGGGGAGGIRCTTGSSVSGRGGTLESQLSLNPGTNYQVTVGAGGTGANTDNFAGVTNGANSSFNNIISLGGGKGAYADTAGFSGGCGSGAAGNDRVLSGGAGTAGQGYDGGSVNNNNGGPGGGGGGTASAGGSPAGNNSAAGNGGSALSNNITGSSVYYGAGGAGSMGYFGNVNGSNGTGWNYTNNTGAGGNGLSASTFQNGCSGVVILRYPAGKNITIGSGLTGSTVTVGSNKVTTITQGTGNVSWL